MKKTVKYRREKFAKFEKFLEDREITRNHIHELSFKLNEKINILSDNEESLTRIYRCVAKISANDPDYMRPLSSPNDSLKLALDELDQAVLDEIKSIVSKATGFEL